jgi:hypothetical protein
MQALGANTPRKSDQGKTVAIILAQVDGKVLSAIRDRYDRITCALLSPWTVLKEVPNILSI